MSGNPQVITTHAIRRHMSAFLDGEIINRDAYYGSESHLEIQSHLESLLSETNDMVYSVCPSNRSHFMRNGSDLGYEILQHLCRWGLHSN